MARKVDQSALKVNQGFIIGLLLLAFVVDSVWLVAFVGVVMLLGTAVPRSPSSNAFTNTAWNRQIL